MITLSRPIKAITFDVGYTVLYPAADVGEMYQLVLGRHGIDVDPKLLKEQFFLHWKAYVANKDGLIYGTTHDEALAFWGEILHKMLNYAFPDRAFPVELLARSLYDEFSGAGTWRLVADWDLVLDHCRKLGVKVGFLSNWDLRLGALLAELGLSDQVDFKIISAEHALEKPSAAIFERAALEANVHVTELLHIGDTWRDDIIGATNAGCQAIWLNNEGTSPPSEIPPEAHIINQLIELIALQF